MQSTIIEATALFPAASHIVCLTMPDWSTWHAAQSAGANELVAKPCTDLPLQRLLLSLCQTGAHPAA